MGARVRPRACEGRLITSKNKTKVWKLLCQRLLLTFSPRGREGRDGRGLDDKAGEMMGCRCPSPTSEDETLRPKAVDKETCSAEDHKGISSFILHLC